MKFGFIPCRSSIDVNLHIDCLFKRFAFRAQRCRWIVTDVFVYIANPRSPSYSFGPFNQKLTMVHRELPIFDLIIKDIDVIAFRLIVLKMSHEILGFQLI